MLYYVSNICQLNTLYDYTTDTQKPHTRSQALWYHVSIVDTGHHNTSNHPIINMR